MMENPLNGDLRSITMKTTREFEYGKYDEYYDIDRCKAQNVESAFASKAIPNWYFSHIFSADRNYSNDISTRERSGNVNDDPRSGCETESKCLYPGIYVVSYKHSVSPEQLPSPTEPKYGKPCSVIMRPGVERSDDNLKVPSRDEVRNESSSDITNHESNDDSSDGKYMDYDSDSISTPDDMKESEAENFPPAKNLNGATERSDSNRHSISRKRAKRIYIYNPKPIVKRPSAPNDDKTKDEAYWRHRQYNNAAARRSRANRRAKEMEIMNQAKVLNDENRFLTARVKELERKNDYLKSLLLKQGHVNISDL